MQTIHKKMTIRRLKIVSTLAMLLIVMTGAATAADKKLKVVTTFTVLAEMARNVAGDHAQVVSITKPGAEIHGYEPTPQDIVRASNADLILWNGLNLELWFEQFLVNLGDIPSVTLTEGIDPISITEGAYEGQANPHAWMGLDNAMVYVDNIAAAFAEYDPDNADAYRANAKTYKDEIRDTIEPLRNQIARIPEDKRWLVTCEGAFSYLARDFGMKELYLWPMNAGQVGTPQQVRSVIDGVNDKDIPVVFCESTVNTSPAEQIAHETGAAYGGVLYVDSLSKTNGPVPTYLDLLRVTSQTVADGLTKNLKQQ